MSFQENLQRKRYRLWTGNEAVAHAAVAAGCRFFAGYPITPSSEIAETLASLLPRHGGVFIQMEDEIAAISAVLGASLAGVRSMTATSGPGFSLKQEGIGFGCATEIPIVVVDVMRVGPSTGMPTLPSQGDVMQARWGTHGDHPIIALCPESVSEAFKFTVNAFNLADKFRTPVILLLDEVVGHLTEKILVPTEDEIVIEKRKEPTCEPQHFLPYAVGEDLVPKIPPFGKGYRFHITGLLHDETGFPTNEPKVAGALIKRLHQKLELARENIDDVEVIAPNGVEFAVFSYGATARSAKAVLKRLWADKVPVGLVRPKSIWPFPEKIVKQALQGCKSVLVVEMNLGQLAEELRKVLPQDIIVETLSKVGGEPVTPGEIAQALKRFFNG